MTKEQTTFEQKKIFSIEPCVIEPDELMEFVCPENLDDVETEYCESKAMNNGCRELKTCRTYQKQKQLETEHPQICWKTATNKDKKGYDELYSKMLMIKKGIIVLPKVKQDE